MSFNLLDSRWIPVLRINGKRDTVSIREALTKAPEIREVSGASPLDTIALYRFLVAVLQWCEPDPTEHELHGVRRTRAFPAAWLTKLDQHKRRFDLLGTDYGFYQGKEYCSDVGRPVTDLLPELPSGSSVSHFRHTRDFVDGLCPACCALGLVRLSAFAPSGTHPVGKKETRFRAGKPAGINGPTPVYALPIGETLLETLLLNWPMPMTAEDRPAWLSDDPLSREHIGCLAALTWRPRRVWLARPSDAAPQEACAYCGKEGPLIHRIAFLPGWRQPFKKEKRWPHDPHLLVYIQGSAVKPVPPPAPSQHVDLHARFWRKAYAALLQALAGVSGDGAPAQHRHICRALEESGQHEPVAVACFWPATDPGRGALYKDGAFLVVRLPPDGLPPAAAAKALRELDWLNTFSLARIIKKILPGGRGKYPELKSALANASPGAEARLRERFDSLLRGLAQDQPQALNTWRNAVKSCLADHLHEAFATVRKGSPLRNRELTAAANSELQRAFATATASQG